VIVIRILGGLKPKTSRHTFFGGYGSGQFHQQGKLSEARPNMLLALSIAVVIGSIASLFEPGRWPLQRRSPLAGFTDIQ
jgi:hypothetical protein